MQTKETFITYLKPEVRRRTLALRFGEPLPEIGGGIKKKNPAGLAKGRRGRV